MKLYKIVYELFVRHTIIISAKNEHQALKKFKKEIRNREGLSIISLSEYKNKFGFDFICSREDKIKEYIKCGYMKKTDDRLFLTEKGFYVSNTILTDLL